MHPKKNSSSQNRKRKLDQQEADSKHPKIIGFYKKIKLSEIETNISKKVFKKYR